MKTLLISLFITVSFSNRSGKTDSVYLCMGNYSHAYHATLNCKGLRNCKGKEIKVSLYDATHKYNRKACGYCER